jgi:hypothetical protein
VILAGNYGRLVLRILRRANRFNDYPPRLAQCETRVQKEGSVKVKIKTPTNISNAAREIVSVRNDTGSARHTESHEHFMPPVRSMCRALTYSSATGVRA